MDKFGVDHCEDIKVSELPEGQSCEDFYSRQNLFTLCRGNLRWQSSSHCARGSNFTCWVPGVSNLKDAKAAGIRRLDESGSGESGSGETGSGDCEGEDCLEVGPWLVPPGKMPYPNGPDGQPAEYPEGVCPNGCNPGGTNPGEIPKDHLSVHKGDHSADGEWGFCWCPNPNDGPYAFPDKDSLQTAVQAYNIDPTDAIARYGPIADWDVSAVTDMSGLFQNGHEWAQNGYATKKQFNADISRWDTSAVTAMKGMFYGTTAFNQPLPWVTRTSRVTDMSSMFGNAVAFNQPLSFDTSSVTGMGAMFRNAAVFNQPLRFDTSNVTVFLNMFNSAAAFNQPLKWDTSNAEDMRSMFKSANALSDANKVLILCAWASNTEWMLRDGKAWSGLGESCLGESR